MTIKKLKIENRIYQNIEVNIWDDDTKKLIPNPLIPTNLEEFRALAIDTVQTEIGQKVKKEAKTQINLSASTSKYALMLYKIIKENNLTTDTLTEKEKATLAISDTLIDQGYSDSDLMLNTLEKVRDYRVESGIKIDKIQSAGSIEEIISILNEV